jgi:hypothetical protein
MSGYHLAGWTAFFVAVIGAGAALTGLVFVAVSINLDRIVSAGSFLSSRAAETMATLLLVVVSSSLALVPQGARWLGVEILAIAAPLLLVTLRTQVRHRRAHRDDPLLWHVARVSCTGVATIPACLAGISLVVRWGGGVYWLVPTALLGMTGAMFTAWVLLIEIAR